MWSDTPLAAQVTVRLCLIYIIKFHMNKKNHGRENDSVEVVDEVQKSEVALREEAIQQFWEEQDI